MSPYLVALIAYLSFGTGCSFMTYCEVMLDDRKYHKLSDHIMCILFWPVGIAAAIYYTLTKDEA